MPPLSLTLTKHFNKLNGITCYEPVNYEILEKLLNTDLLQHYDDGETVWNEEKQLKKYKQLIDKETNLASVEYNQKISYGRSNPKNGMFVMRRAIRHSLGDVMEDWDIVNAHPVMLLQLCKANGLACSNLDYYVNHRTIILQSLMTAVKCSKDRAKRLFIQLLYFGTFEGWVKGKFINNKMIEPEIDLYAFKSIPEILTLINDLIGELKKIGEHILSSNPKLLKEVEKMKDKKGKELTNKMGSVVSHFLQEYEVRILEVLYDYCCEKGYIQDNIVVLCADGLMLLKDFVKEKDLSVEFNTIVKEKTGFDLQFTKKEMDECIPLAEIEKHTLSIKSLDDTKFAIFNTEYFISLKGYKLKKLYFEVFCAKILRPDPVYVFIEKEKGLDEMSFYTANKINDAFNHLKTGECYDNGEEVKFITTWLNDESIRCYNKMDFIPFNDRHHIEPHIFNLFRGFNECITIEFKNGDKMLKPFIDLGIQLCEGDETYFNYFIKYLADIIQNPNKKNPIAFIVKGKQGSGKNVFLNAIGNVIGKHHYITSSNPKDFFGDYAEGFYHKLLVNMNECEGKDTFEFEGRIKSFITEDTITLNRKFVQPTTIANLARLVIFTNKENPIPIDVRTKDRRYVCFKTTDEYLKPKYGSAFWKQLVSHFNRPDFIACLYDYLNTIDLSTTDWRSERPITKSYLDMCKLYVPTEALFLEHQIVRELHLQNLTEGECYYNASELYEQSGIEGQTLYRDYLKWAKEFGFLKEGSYQKNIKCFYGKVNELSLSITSKKPANIITFYFNFETILKEMKDRKWIDICDDDEVVVVNEVKGDDFTDYFDME